MTENYEEELKLIDYATAEHTRVLASVIAVDRFNDHFNPAHMRQRIEREMAKDERLAELTWIIGNQDARIKELEEFIEFWRYVGSLQTHNSREQFRTQAEAMLK